MPPKNPMSQAELASQYGSIKPVSTWDEIKNFFAPEPLSRMDSNRRSLNTLMQLLGLSAPGMLKGLGPGGVMAPSPGKSLGRAQIQQMSPSQMERHFNLTRPPNPEPMDFSHLPKLIPDAPIKAPPPAPGAPRTPLPRNYPYGKYEPSLPSSPPKNPTPSTSEIGRQLEAWFKEQFPNWSPSNPSAASLPLSPPRGPSALAPTRISRGPTLTMP